MENGTTETEQFAPMNLEETYKRKNVYVAEYNEEDLFKFREEFTQEFSLFTESYHQKTIGKVDIL